MIDQAMCTTGGVAGAQIYIQDWLQAPEKQAYAWGSILPLVFFFPPSKNQLQILSKNSWCNVQTNGIKREMEWGGGGGGRPKICLPSTAEKNRVSAVHTFTQKV
jgi:hypothetical protein